MPSFAACRRERRVPPDAAVKSVEDPWDRVVGGATLLLRVVRSGTEL
jgi:hypothetical protein